MRKLPPLYSLQCFEATARLGTVREAANRLCISPSAVSHQIAKLEDYLDTLLFHRQHKRLILTDAGYNYLKQIEQALECIEEATWNSLERTKAEQLILSLPPSFSTLWLIPKLDEFMQSCPDVNIKMMDNLTIDECLDDVDCGIEYRFSPASDRFSEKLFDDEIIPLASPAFVHANELQCLDDMKGKTLIITERRFNSWKVVLKDYDWIGKCRVISVRYTYQALNAAVLGLGVALGNRHNAKQFIDDGKLVSPFEISFDESRGPAYFFSCKKESLLKPKEKNF